MKYLHIFLFGILISVTISCSSGQTQTYNSNLSAIEFADKLKTTPEAVIVDVRTPEEFSDGHLAGARNIDWNGNGFDREIALLEKTKPIFVYCLSGGRSSAAAGKMRADGFREVYEMNGGIMKWRASALPETKDNSSKPAGMSRQQFNTLIKSDTAVLVDFYADWCEPCKRMKPYLEEISKDMSDKIIVLRINADDNPELLKELGIDALPVLQLYKNNSLTWKNTGYIDKAAVVQQINK